MTLIDTSDGKIPADTFAVRLAIVRTVKGWNYDQAETATGIGSESWRTWEKGLRRCSDQIGVARLIGEATGISPIWIAHGGSLLPAPQSPVGRPRNGRKLAERRPTASKVSRICNPRKSSVTAGYNRIAVRTTGESAHTRRAA